jgi:hypothetical protein
MKKVLLASVFTLGLVTPSLADIFTFGTLNLTLSDFAGVQQFGTVTVTDQGGGVAKVVEDVSPNFIIDTGGPHAPLAFNAVGTVTFSDFSSPFFAGGAQTQAPFGDFTNSVQGNCNSGGSGGGCGTSTMSFLIHSFAGFTPTLFSGTLSGQTYTNAPIFFAGDILYCPTSACTGGTGNVAAVPGPIVGAGLPGILIGCLGMLGLARRRITKWRGALFASGH